MCQALFRKLLFFWTFWHCISLLISHNHAESALGWPCTRPSPCTPSLTGNVRGCLATWRMVLGKSPGVFRHCCWPENQNTHKNSQWSWSAQGTCCSLLFVRPFLGQAAALFAMFAGLLALHSHCEARHISDNEPGKWGHCGFRWMLFLSPRQCWLGYREQEVVYLTRYGSFH